VTCCEVARRVWPSRPRSVPGLYGLAVADRFGAGEAVRLCWSAGSALGSRSVHAGVVLRLPALPSIGLFAGHAV
jgi:hypothetical protein